MSMINGQINELRKYAQLYRMQPYGREVDGTPDVLDKAANTIEALFAKLSEDENKIQKTEIECPYCGTTFYYEPMNEDEFDVKFETYIEKN